MAYDQQEGVQYLIREGLVQKHAAAIMHVVQKNEYSYFNRLATKEQVSLLENNFRTFTQFSTNKTDIDKVILELKADNGSLRTDLYKFRTELKTDIDNVRTELKADIDNVRTELKTDIDNVRTELKADIEKVESYVDKVRTELKGDIAKVATDLDKVRTELKTDIANLRTELKGDIAKVATEVDKLKIEMLQIEKRFMKKLHRSEVKLMLMIGGSVVTNCSIIIGALKYFH